MIDRGKQNVLGIRVNAVDYEAAVGHIITAARERKPLAVSALAVHGLMTGVLDREQCHRLNRLDLVVPDGQPVRWALNWLHRVKLPERVYGPELMLRVCARAAEEKLPIFLFGGKSSLLRALRSRLEERFPGLIVAGARPSKFRPLSGEEREELNQAILSSGAALTFVGLGCPRQEVWAYEHRESLSMPLLAVGAAFNFHAGELAQAPTALQNRGLEWLYRLIKEPRRLWKRYLFLNPMYLSLLLLQRCHMWTLKPDRGIPPDQDLRYG